MCDTVTRVFPTKSCCRDIISKNLRKIYRKVPKHAVVFSFQKCMGKSTERLYKTPSICPQCQKDVGKCIDTFQNMLSHCFVKNVRKNEKKRLKICRRFVCSKRTGKIHRNVPKHAVVLFCQTREDNCTENF